MDTQTGLATLTSVGGGSGTPQTVSISAGGKVLRKIIKQYRNPEQVSSITTTLDNGQSSMVAYTYADQCTPRISSKKEYDFSGNLMRETDVSYFTSAADNTNLCPAEEWAGNSWDDAYLQNGHHIVDIPSNVKVYGAGGCCTSPISQTNYTYDSTALSTTSGSLGASVLGLQVPWGSGGQTTSIHDDASFGASMTRRGNPTVISQGNSQTTLYYNILGEVVKTVDGRGYATYFDYTDSWNDASCISTHVFAYPTTVTNALGQQAKTTYNSCDGSASSVQDQNDINAGRAATVYTYDNMQRVTSVSYPDGGNTGTNYGGTAIPEVITTTTTATPSPSQVSSATLDGMGRTITAVAPSGATVNTVYDTQGRVYTVSNPYFSTSDPTYGLTTYTYNALNQKTQQVDSDKVSKQVWNYNGPTVTFQNENGNQWQRTSDALGRLTSVVEPGSLQTNYTYDALNNLLKVNQAGNGTGDAARTRTFNYDSLSRLLCASNPENSTAVCAATNSGYVAGTTGYTYDANGNVLSKTDARGVTTNYSYDALNRMLSKSYSDGATPYSCYQYDASTTANSIGRLSAEWTVPGSQSGGCTATAPTILTMRTIAAYDLMGRVLSQQQCTPNASGPGNCTSSSPNPFALSYVYNLAGNPTAYTNGVSNVPSVGTIVFGLQYDGAGRLQNLGSSWNPAAGSSGGQLSLFTADPTSGYAPFGAIQNMILGNNVFVNKTYDNRLRTTAETATHP
jgi:YD repeat-containing protein